MGDRAVHLRLAGTTGSGGRGAPLVVDRSSPVRSTVARREVEQEVRAAASLAPGDSRRILALRVMESLEGGRAAILRPEARHQVLSLATSLGLRAFDANLVIAIVQDGARRGETSLDADGESRLQLVGGGTIERGRRRRVMMHNVAVNLIAAGVLGVGVAAVLIAWILGH